MIAILNVQIKQIKYIKYKSYGYRATKHTIATSYSNIFKGCMHVTSFWTFLKIDYEAFILPLLLTNSVLTETMPCVGISQSYKAALAEIMTCDINHTSEMYMNM